MKYYCKSCKSIIIPGMADELFEDAYCHICGTEDSVTSIPDYETLEQYEKRTGEQVSDYTAVFQYRGDWDRGNAINWRWEIKALVSAKHTEFCKYPTKYIVIADPPVPPPDGWRPL